MEDKVSIRGRTARRMVRFANQFPLWSEKMQSGELRLKLYEREKKWECPKHLELETFEENNVLMEWLKKKETVSEGIILQLHGGGYYGKLRNVYRDMAGMYNEVSNGLDVLSVDYRVAPEFPFPAALEDAIAAYQWILNHNYSLDKVFVAGDSAGGGLALALCLYLRDHHLPMPAGVITMSAWTDLTKSGESYQENFKIDPIFGQNKHSLVYKDGYYRNDTPDNPYISPVKGEYHGFPPVLMQVGEYEMLLSDTCTVAQKAREAGVMVKEHIYTGMFHVFQMGLLLYPEAKEAWLEVGRFIRSLIKKTDRGKNV